MVNFSEKPFAERISLIIKKINITPYAFAKKIGVSDTRIANIIKGRNNPDSELLGKVIEEYPQISSAWLLTGKGEMFLESEKNVNANTFFSNTEEKEHHVFEPSTGYDLPEEKQLTTGPEDGPGYGRQVVGEYGPAYQSAIERIELLERLLAEKERLIEEKDRTIRLYEKITKE